MLCGWRWNGSRRAGVVKLGGDRRTDQRNECGSCDLRSRIPQERAEGRRKGSWRSVIRLEAEKKAQPAAKANNRMDVSGCRSSSQGRYATAASSGHQATAWKSNYDGPQRCRGLQCTIALVSLYLVVESDEW